MPAGRRWRWILGRVVLERLAGVGVDAAGPGHLLDERRRPQELAAKTGAIKWHFQHTPNDPYDYDSVSENVLVDAGGYSNGLPVSGLMPRVQVTFLTNGVAHRNWPLVRSENVLVDAGGKKMALEADRNGFAYAVDRTNGQFLWATPFVKKVTWTTRCRSRRGRSACAGSAT
jgi:outer membrane protein assembly factor BamB